MRPTNWSLIFILCAVIGVLTGYIYALLFRPSLLPPLLRLGGLREPETVLFLGTDVVYSDFGNRKKADKDAFCGRSDTIMVARLDPYRNSLDVISIPRDTRVYIPGFGMQKINAANALGGPDLTLRTVSSLLSLPVNRYLILNVHGLVDLVNELGGVTVEIPKRMRYMDWTAKLRIDLEPGFHTLTGNQAMGFVRYRHDALGDIGRVQRQEMFVRALLDTAMRPQSWAHFPKLISIAQNYIDTNMSMSFLVTAANFVRGVPKSNQHLVMLPGTFSGTGDWLVQPSDVQRVVAKFIGTSFISLEKRKIRLVLINASSSPGLAFRLSRYLRSKGYEAVSVKYTETMPNQHYRTRIIAQRANPEDADQVRDDFKGIGELVYASVGDIESGVTVMAGDDLLPLISVETDKAKTASNKPKIRHRTRHSY